jgi:hypothetical protein
MESEKKDSAVWDDDAKSFLLPPSGLAPESPAPPPAEEDREDETDAGVVFPFVVPPKAPQAAEPEAPPVRPARRPAPPATTPVPDEEPFDRPGTTRVGLLGGKGVGKSYLFHSMVYRTLDSRRSGALTYYIARDSVRIYQTLDRSQTPRSIIPAEFIQNYASWTRLFSTLRTGQYWYRLRLQFRTGLLGTRKAFLDIDFLDGSGEEFEEGISQKTEELWKEAFLDARVMVFCLPLWAAFPASGGVLSDEDWEERRKIIKGFDSIVRHYKDLREKYRATHRVRSILALTMADDRRSALAMLRNRWIHPFASDPMLHLRAMRRASGVARYLSSARQVSEAIWQEFDASPDPVISGIPVSLDFGAGRPWFIPVSAIDGAVLDRQGAARGAGLPPPVPVHVELPLLVALCASHNALM